MKTLFKKCMLATAVVSLLSACDTDDDYSPIKNDGPNLAPVHGGDISKNYHEKDGFEFVYLMGSLDGKQSGEGIAVDEDGDLLRVENLTSNLDDMTGIELDGHRVGIRPDMIAPNIDTDEVFKAVLTYDITDGRDSVSRTLTVEITGEDSAPVAEGDLVGNFTKDAGVGMIDLLTNVSDADEEPLTVTDLMASADNPFELTAAIVDNMLEIDIEAVKAQIPDGEKVSFAFTYKVKDHRFEIERNLVVNILGVKDVPEAPLIGSYFLEEMANETDTVQMYDLGQDVVDREGDDIVVKNLKVDGSDLIPYGFELAGNTLNFDPHAFFNDVADGEFKTFVVTFNVADVNDNTSDGERTLTITLNGEETNLIAASGFNANFEDPAYLGPLDQNANPGGFNWGWASWACPEAEIRTTAARTGDYGFRMAGSFCHFEVPNVIAEIENDQKYAMSYWLRNEASNGPNGNPFVPLFANVGDSGLDNRFWWGTRYYNQELDQWFEHIQLVNTNDGGNWDGYETLPMNFGVLKYDDTYAGGAHDIDDLSMVKFGHFDTALHDMVMGDAGLFEAEEVVDHNDGLVEIRDVEGVNKLFIDTTGAADGVVISLPVKAGAIKAGGRFALSMQAQLINHDAKYGVDTNTQVPFQIELSNGLESIAGNGEGVTWGPNDSTVDVIITEEFGRTAELDWSEEDMVLNIRLDEADAQYYLDNVRLIAIP